MKDFGKKQIIVIALVVMIGIAGYINWTYKNKNEAAIPATAEYGTDLSEYVLEDGTIIIDSKTQDGEEIQEFVTTDENGDVSMVSEAVFNDGTATAKKEQATPANVGNTSYFSVARVEKQKARSEAVDIYNGLINNANSSAEAKTKAEQDISNVAKFTEQETMLENLIKAKGFEEAVVYLSGDDARVVVKSKGLVPAQVAQIKDVILQNAELSAEQIKIVEIF